MYRKTKRIPTIIALFILIIGLGGGIFLIENRTSSKSIASPSNIPQSVLVTNLNDTYFSVTWLTAEKVSGFVNFGTTNKDISQVAFDDRDTNNQPKSYKTHQVTIRNLTPNTAYYFKIASGNKQFINGDKPYYVLTSPKTEMTSMLEPAYGDVVDSQNKPAEGALVILTIPKCLPLSTLVKPSGSWLITLNTARDETTLQPLITENVISESIKVFASVETDNQAQATADSKNDSPVPTITLGKSYNFENLQGKKKTETEIAQNNSPTKVLGKQTVNKIEILSPEDGATFVSNRPLFRGQGIPGKEVTIEVHSLQIISGKTKVDTKGVWSWTPPTNIDAGNHTVIITTTDENGEKITIERKFLVFKSGTQVLGEATPSGTLATPTPTRTGTPTPTISGYPTTTVTLIPLYSPTPTTIPPPVSGNISPTYILITVGTILILLGFAKLITAV